MILLRLITARVQASGGGYDPDAQAFFTAAGITNTTEKDAVNTLVLDLKSTGVWTKMYAIYPFVGGTATTHKYNLLNPADTDAAYRLNFLGSWTHSSSGAFNNSGAADTFIVPNSTFSSPTNFHLSLYSRTGTGQISVDMGAQFDGGNLRMEMYLKFVDGRCLHQFGPTTAQLTSQSGLGLCVMNSNSSNFQARFNNNVQNASPATGASLATYPIYVGACSVAYPNYVGVRSFAFSSVGQGLTDTEATDLYTAVQAYQTTLGRQV